MSVAVAEHQLLPAVRSADTTTAILADGYSCAQLADLSDRRGKHLAEFPRDRARRRSSILAASLKCWPVNTTIGELQ